MTPGSKKPTAKKISNNDEEELETAVTLGGLKTDIKYLTLSINNLTDVVQESEKSRNIQWAQYLVDHGKVVADCIGNTEKITRLEQSINKVNLDTAASVAKVMAETTNSINKINRKIEKLPILVWVFGILGIIFLAAVSTLIGEIIKGNVQLIHVIH